MCIYNAFVNVLTIIASRSVNACVARGTVAVVDITFINIDRGAVCTRKCIHAHVAMAICSCKRTKINELRRALITADGVIADIRAAIAVIC